MGITRHAAEVILRARAAGMRLDRTITIGRQVFFVAPDDAGELLRKYGAWPASLDNAGFASSLTKLPYFVDPWLHHAGAKTIDCLDASNFEGANIIHDLNVPLPPALHGKYDCLIDGGAIEHVFNPVVALTTYMQLVRVGGSVIVFTTANNFFGHGFYQFSPDFFYRAFSEDNGFELRRLVAAEDDVLWARLGGAKLPVNVPGRALDVVDPAVAGCRVELRNSCQTALICHAVKTREVPLFQKIPQQSDYARMWEASRRGSNAASDRPNFTQRLKAYYQGLQPATALKIQLAWLPAVFRVLRIFRPSAGFRESRLANRNFYTPPK